jgi:tetratricopeptide (TPR) repeat protein
LFEPALHARVLFGGKGDVMKHHRLFYSAALCTVVLFCSLPALAQGTIEGTVVDEAGNPVAKALVRIAPYEDEDLRTYPVKTNAKGKFFARVGNGEYVATVQAEGWAPGSMTLVIESRREDKSGEQLVRGKLRPVYEWSGKIVPGQEPTRIGIGPEDRATIDFVVVDPETLRAEQAGRLLAMTAAALESGDRAGAMRSVEDLLVATPDDPLGLTIRAYIHAEDGDYEKAEADLNLALEQDPGLYDARYQLAGIYKNTDRHSEAVEAFRQAAEDADTGAQRAKALLSLGEMQRDAGNTDVAIETLEQAVDANPELASAIAPELANLYTATGQIDRANEWLAAAGEEEIDPALQYNLGVIHFNKKEWEPAAECFRKVLSADPAFADAHKNLATALLNLNQREESVEHFRAYLDLRPDAEDAGQIQALVDHLSK